MHKNLYSLFSSTFVAAMLLLVACDRDAIPADDFATGKIGQAGYQDPANTVDTTGEYITFKEAIALVDSLPANGSSTKQYKVRGYISSVGTSRTDMFSYGNCQFNIIANDTASKTNYIQCYNARNIGNVGFKKGNNIPTAGSTVVMKGTFKKYVSASSGSVTREMDPCFIVSYPNYVPAPELPQPRPASGDTIDIVTANEIGLRLANKATSTENYYIIGTVESVKNVDTSSYGNAEFNITDGQLSLICYRLTGLGGKKFTSEEQIRAGDIVVCKAKLQNFNGKVELVKGNLVTTTNTTPY